MAFDLLGWGRASVSYNNDAFQTYNYINVDDDLLEIVSADYFVSQKRILTVNDVIHIVADDENATVIIDTITPTITVSAFTQNVGPSSVPTFTALRLKNLSGEGAIVFSVTALNQAPELADIPEIFINGFTSSMAIGTLNPDDSAKLDLSSTTQGFLPPRMTTAERDAISSPADGLMVYNSTANILNVRIAGTWRDLSFT